MEEVLCVRHWTSGSEVMSFQGVREMWVAVLESKAATRGLSCAGDGGRIEVKWGGTWYSRCCCCCQIGPRFPGLG